MQAHKFSGWIVVNDDEEAAIITQEMGRSVQLAFHGGTLVIESPVVVEDPIRTAMAVDVVPVEPVL